MRASFIYPIYVTKLFGGGGGGGGQKSGKKSLYDMKF